MQKYQTHLAVSGATLIAIALFGPIVYRPILGAGSALLGIALLLFVANRALANDVWLAIAWAFMLFLMDLHHQGYPDVLVVIATSFSILAVFFYAAWRRQYEMT